MDIDSIPPGADFEEHIRSEIEVCDLVLVLIGDNWLDQAPDQPGRRRIDVDDDFVRVEIESALASPNTRVIPVLVEGAEMPRPAGSAGERSRAHPVQRHRARRPPLDRRRRPARRDHRVHEHTPRRDRRTRHDPPPAGAGAAHAAADSRVRPGPAAYADRRLGHDRAAGTDLRAAPRSSRRSGRPSSASSTAGYRLQMIIFAAVVGVSDLHLARLVVGSSTRPCRSFAVGDLGGLHRRRHRRRGDQPQVRAPRCPARSRS